MNLRGLCCIPVLMSAILPRERQNQVRVSCCFSASDSVITRSTRRPVESLKSHGQIWSSSHHNPALFFNFFLRQSCRERGIFLPLAHSPNGQHEQAELGKSKARRQKFLLGFSCGCRSPSTWFILSCFPRLITGSWIRSEHKPAPIWFAGITDRCFMCYTTARAPPSPHFTH